MKDGTENEKSEPEDTTPAHTASAVGTVGGDLGLNAAITKPLIA